MRSIVIASLPKAGLGNKLFVWALAEMFAQINRMPACILGWSYPRIGTIIRHERRDIFYGRHLNVNYIQNCIGLIKLGALNRCYEPSLSQPMTERGSAYIFNQIPHWKGYFESLHPYRDAVRQSFWALPRSTILDMVGRMKAPTIAIHVRRGDFRELRSGEDFAKVGGVRTPVEYFLRIIRNLRDCAGWDVPVTIFSDGSNQELAQMLALSYVERAPAMPDIGHLMLMARSKVIVASAGSTFSMWAGFLSDAALILHPDHIQGAIRPSSDPHNRLYEGSAVGEWEEWDPVLVRSIQSLR